MKLYGFILLFLIVLMIFSGSVAEKENFNIFSDVSHMIHNGIVIAGAAGNVAVKSAKYAEGAVNASKESQQSIPDALDQAHNINTYLTLMRERVAKCGSAAKEILGDNADVELSPPTDCSKVPKGWGRQLRCKARNKISAAKNAASLALKVSKIHSNFKKNYKKHLESETCKEMRLALQARIDKGVDVPTAAETLNHLALCNTCGDRHSAMMAKPLDSHKITEIGVNANKTLAQWPAIGPTLEVLTSVANNLET